MRHKRTKKRMTNKQALTTIIYVGAAIAVLIAALIIIGPIMGGNTGGHYEGDGHDHGTNSGAHYEGDGHDHGTSSTNNAKVKYQIYTNADKTYRVVFQDANGKTLYEVNNIAKQPMKETVNADKGVYTLSWASGSGPNDFYQVYYNEKTGQVSEKFHAPRGTDGVRIAYGSEDQTKIIVQDLFDKSAYYKEYALENVQVNGSDIIVGGTLKADNKTVVISYVKDGTSQHAIIKLYE